MSSCCRLLFALVSLLLAFASSKEESIDCDVPAIFEVHIDDNKRIFIYDPEITVKYKRNDLAIYEYPETDRVNILINNSVVLFSGHVLQNEGFDPDAVKTSRILDTKIAGSAQLIRNTHSNDVVTDCNIYLARNRKNDDWDLSKNIQTEVLHQAALCLKSSICKKLGEIKLDDIMNAANHPYDFGSLSVATSRSSIERESDEMLLVQEIGAENLTALMSSIDELETNNIDKVQSTINIIVDVVIAEIVREMRKENDGTIKIPDIKQKFFLDPILKLSGEFDATDGYFSDVTTLSRIGDASLAHVDKKFIASCGFGFSKANIRYTKYKLSYGLKVGGKIWADVKGVSVYVTVSVDFNEKPCKVRLQDLRLIKLGTIKIRVTGLGPLNGLTSKLVTWITDKWRDEIAVQVQAHVKEYVEDYVAKLNCEKFRP